MGGKSSCRDVIKLNMKPEAFKGRFGELSCETRPVLK